MRRILSNKRSDIPVGVARRQAVATARQNQLKPAIDEDKIFRSVGALKYDSISVPESWSVMI